MMYVMLIFWINCIPKSKKKKKRPGFERKKVRFHLDNAPTHKAISVMAKVHEMKFEILLHSSYSPDMVPSDNNFFPNLKKILSERNFCSDIEVISATYAYSEAFEESTYREGGQASPYLWSKCMSLEEDYVEK
ncbi:Mariner Mos1 transposase like protein [Argiope bruennichi]|uniref:Mariner Mos1 transposase like protein n=1 Tax=Argiope bruennichi TaxID=94029 RepID=A0A8T0E494_ARGBR|nr:Mariner Mos1 transposase like protein [Argiope bruennichi]